MADDDEEGGGGGGWLISYADLMTLLFAAFVVLYGITPQGETNELLGILSSIRESFIEIPDEIIEAERKGQLFNAKRVFTKVKPEQSINKAIKRYNREETLLVGENQDRQRIEVLLNQLPKGSSVHQALRKGTVLIDDELGFRLRLLSTAYFAEGSSTLNKESRDLIREIAKTLKLKRPRLAIDGHTDFRGKDKSFQGFERSAAMAEAVRREFVAAGFDEKLLHTASYGDLHPAHWDYDGKDTSRNNRVEIRIVME